MFLSLFNTDKYTILELIWNGTGYFFWFIAYVLLARNSFKKKFVEMPFFILAGNVAWEFVWSFIYHSDLGTFFVNGIQVCFFLDLFILSMVFLYGSKQLQIVALKKYFTLIMFVLLILWIPLIYFFVKQGYDTSIGANSGYILNLIISLSCPILYFQSDPKYFSLSFTVCRFIGTSFTTIAKFLIYPNNHFVQTLGVCCFIADLVFTIYLLRNRTKESII
jgi:hypothetical protein